MAGMFKIGPWFVSDALIRPEDLTTEYRLVFGLNYATIKNNTGQQLALNAVGVSGFAHNGLIYETEKVTGADLDVHYIRTPAIETGMVVRNGTYSASSNVLDTLDALIGASVIEDTDSEVSCSVDPSTLTISFLTPEAFTVQTDGSELILDGESVVGNTITVGTITFTADPAVMSTQLSLVRESANIVLPVEPYDAGYNLYTFDLSHTADTVVGLTATEEEVVLAGDTIFDDFGQGHRRIIGEDIYISNLGSYIDDNGTEVYRDTDDHTYISLNGVQVKEYNLTQISSSVNTDLRYVYDLLESTEKVYIAYLRPYSTYVLIDYYFSKTSVADGECAEISDTATATRAIRLKVYADKILSQYAHADIDYIAPKADLTASEIENAYDKMHYGAGPFFAPYKLYYYRDYGDRIKVVFNRETSSKYWTLEVEDQTTRWKATLTQTNGTLTSTLATKYLQRYRFDGIWGIYPVTNPYVLLNMKTKRAFDRVADTLETSFVNSAIDLDPKTIKLYTNIMYLNIANVVSSFPQLRLTYSTLAVMEMDSKFVEIVFQASSGAIYGRFLEGTNYTYIEKDQLVPLMNSIDANYQFTLTCNISKLVYFDEDGAEQNIPFSDSTLIASENIGAFKRIYYKNSSSNGFVIASSYEVQE